jgi:tetratricopeptide (TPR) repeat protein
MLERRVFRRACVRLGLWALLCSSVTQPVSAQPSAAEKSASSEARNDDYTRAIKSAVEAYNRDDFATARKFFARAHELRPSARTWRGLGTTAFELRQFDDAVRELTFALEDRRSPLTPELRSETELTLRVAERRLKENAAPPRPSAAAASAAPPASPPSAAAPEDHGAGLGAQRVAALVAGGLGVVGVGVGVAFGVVSINRGKDRDRACPSHAGCSPQAVDAADAAISAGNVSTVAFIAGGALLAGGLVLWLTGGSEEQQPTAAVSFAPGSVAVSGRF